MKYLKQLYSLIIIGFLAFSCNQNERSVGFNDWTDDGTEYKFYLGTDATVDVVKGYNDNWTSRKYDEMRTFFNDTVKITFNNGQTVTLDEFVEVMSDRDVTLDSMGASLNWNLARAFSVDIDPTQGGEHVHASYEVEYNVGENTTKFNSNIWFYVVDGKIVTVDQQSRPVID